MLKKITFCLLILLLVFSLACDSAQREKQENADKKDVAVTDSGAKKADVEDQKTSPAESSMPKDKELDLQANHPNGTVLRVTKVSYNDDSIVLDFSVTNGHKYQIKLAQGGMQIKDNGGNQYNLSPPQANPDIEIEPNSTIKGTLTFLGRISPKADSLTLTTNHKYGSRTNEYDRTPTMVIDRIPAER